jgi:hypothetical protein
VCEGSGTLKKENTTTKKKKSFSSLQGAARCTNRARDFSFFSFSNKVVVIGESHPGQ